MALEGPADIPGAAAVPDAAHNMDVAGNNSDAADNTCGGSNYDNNKDGGNNAVAAVPLSEDAEGHTNRAHAHARKHVLFHVCLPMQCLLLLNK